MTNPNDATEVVPFLTSAATIVYIQKWLKHREVYQRFVAAFPGADKWAHWLAAGIMSAITAAGIHFVWNCTGCQTWTPENGGIAQIQIPGVVAMIHGLADFWKVYILQHFGHDAVSQAAQLEDKHL